MYQTAKIAARAIATLRDPRWASVLARDAAQDGLFVFAVTTTGIYCKPSCSSRRPRPENVRFHASCNEAELAGFRPCRRCRPEQPAHQARHAERIAQACRLIEASHPPLTLEELAQQVGLSRFYFHQLFKNHTGMTPRAYARMHGARSAADQKAHGSATPDAASAPRAELPPGSEWFARVPAHRRAVSIRYLLGDCSLGRVLVARSEYGVCAILLGDDADVLREELLMSFGGAEAATDAQSVQVLARVQAFLESPGGGLDLPLDVRGTVFQQRVWRALQQIPAGTLLTYGQLAERIGKPGSVRAVANACAANLLAVAIPCHRAIRADGNLAGYRWGLERKRALLAREGQGSRAPMATDGCGCALRD